MLAGERHAIVNKVPQIDDGHSGITQKPAGET
jgi:hypothetical protein